MSDLDVLRTPDDDGEAALRAAAGPDWPDVRDDPAALAALRHALEVRRLREAGIRPDSYTQAAHCDHCGPVWLWPGAPDRVLACPWCFGRTAGKPIPRPPAHQPEPER